MYNLAKSNTMYSNVYPFEMGNVADSQTNGELTFNLPNQSTTFVAKATSIEAYAIDDYTWYGELTGEEQGTVLLIAKEGRVDGRINVDDEVYLIQSLSQGKSILLDIDESNFTETECFFTNTTDTDIDSLDNSLEVIQNNQSSSVEVRDGCEDLPIRVLFLYTAAAANVCAPNSTANMVIAQLNQVVENSGINKQEDLRFAKAGVAALSSFTESTVPLTDINLINLPSTSPVHIDANNLRDQYEADLVVVFTDANYTIATGSGTATIFGVVAPAALAPGVTLGGPDLPFAIVEIDAALTQYTAVHEIAHLLGGRHQRCSLFGSGCDNEPGEAHGNGWGERKCWLCKWKNFSTIMHVIRNGNTKLPNFSNPDIDHNGYPTGALGIRDNANVFEVNGCEVAQYRDFTPPLSASINGPNFIESAGPFTWTSIVNNGTGPYSYYWSYSTDGFNYYTSSSNSSSLTMLVPSPPGGFETLYLRLDVIDALGESVTVFFPVINGGDGCIICLDDDNTAENSMLIYPNPASTTIQITFEVKQGEEGEVNFMLTDYSGNIIQNIPQGDLKAGSYFINTSLENTASGMHVIKIQKGSKVETKKLFIIH